jgi:hypothetical protein
MACYDAVAEDQRRQTNNARLYKDGFHSLSRWQVWANKRDHVKHKPLLEEQTRTPLKVCQHIGSEHARNPLHPKKKRKITGNWNKANVDQIQLVK